jgi:S-adenosylmethionine hydrolase
VAPPRPSFWRYDPDMPGPLITLTTDFGIADPSVAICKGVILSIVPDARLVDVSHSIARHDVAEGSALLWAALPHLPGTHMAVVDPGVGTTRRGVAIRSARGDVLIGPDNGLLPAAAEALGGVVTVHELVDPHYRRTQVSDTFHARDVFAPATAHVAAGVPIDRLGPALDPATLQRIEVEDPSSEPGALAATLVAVDSFGSAQLMATRLDLDRAIGPLEPGAPLRVEWTAPDGSVGRATVPWQRTYGDVETGRPLILVDSYGRLAVAVNRGSAATVLGLSRGMRVRISRP